MELTARHFTGHLRVYKGVRSYRYDKHGLTFQHHTHDGLAPTAWLSAAEYDRVDIEPESRKELA